MDVLLGFLTRQKWLVLLLIAVLVVFGVLAWERLPIDAFPDVTNVQVMVLTEAPGLAPEDVERQITFPIELAMNGLPGVREIRSLSKATLSQVVVVFDDEVDTYFARQQVFERLASVRDQLPAGSEPELGPISTGLGEIYQYTLQSKKRGPMELRTLQDWLVAPQLKSIPGVTEVNSFGGQVRQFHVEVDPAALLEYGIGLQAVIEALAANNANAGGSFILKGWEQAYVRSVGLIRDRHDIEAIVLHARDGTPVTIADVARVDEGPETRQGAVTRDGQGEVVAGMVILLKGENSKQVVDRVRGRIARIQAELPGDVEIDPFYDRTSLIEACIRTVSSSLLIGGLLVIAVLFLFLWNLRAALTVALSLPLTALCAFILMDLDQLTANLMSLGGLAIAIGMMVDGAIVVTENAVRHLQSGGPPAADSGACTPGQVAYRATREVARPVAFAILIIVVVLLPLFALEQMEGKMFRPLALTMVFAMLGSLVVSLGIVPGLVALLLRPRRRTASGSGGWLQSLYRPVLDRALAHPGWTLGLAVVLVASAVGLVPLLGTEFLPELDEGAVAINVVRLPSASLPGSIEVARLIERRLGALPEVATVVSKTGRAEVSEDPMGPEQTDVVVILEPRDRWPRNRSHRELVDEMRAALADLPGLRLAFSQPIALRVNELISGIKSDVAVKLFGPDLDRLRRSAERIAAVLNAVPGAADVRVEQISGLLQLQVTIDRRAIARYKLNVADVNELIATGVGGRIATVAALGQQRVAVQVRFPESRRRDPEALGRLLLVAPGGARVPLARVARIELVEAPAQISRQDGMRRIVVECNVRGRDLGGFVDQLRAELAPLERALPTGYRIDIGGQFENQQRAMARLAWVVPLAVGLVFVFLFVAFGALRPALLVLLNLPFALVGGVWVLAAGRLPLSVSAAVGFVVLFGIAVENGVVLVSFFRQLGAEGLAPGEAVRRGCALRLRPLLMTTMTTLLGLAPMLFASGSGAEIQRPLAAVVLGGLVTSTGLTLFVLPVLYRLVERRFGDRPACPEPKPGS